MRPASYFSFIQLSNVRVKLANLTINVLWFLDIYDKMNNIQKAKKNICRQSKVKTCDAKL